MKKIKFIFKGISLALCLCTTIRAEQFEFHNKTKYLVSIALGSESNPPKPEQTLILGSGASVDKIIEINPNDAPQILLILDESLKYTFQLNAAQGKNIKLKLTSGLLNGKIDLEPQLVPNNIKKDEIVLVGHGSL